MPVGLCITLKGSIETTWLIKPEVFTLWPFVGNLPIPVLNLRTEFSFLCYSLMEC